MAALLAPITDRIEWMSIESAEMTKHAVNAFLATSVTFANELAALCERAGADAKQVERGLRTERRIGPQAYLSPGGAFAGGTLARDVAFLRALEASLDCPRPMDGVVDSKAAARLWQSSARSRRRQPRGKKIAVGAYLQAGTDTIRRCSSIELCGGVGGEQSARHDPEATG